MGDAGGVNVALKVGIIGSCLSNIPAIFLVNEFGLDRINNHAMGRSDQFCARFLDQEKDLPPFEVMTSLLGIPEDDPRDALRYLMENYPERSGLTELDRRLPSLLDNLERERFDVILLDNLCDLQDRRTVVAVDGYGDLRFTFPHNAAGNDLLAKHARYDDALTPEESFENWQRIIGFLQAKQPEAKIVFSLAPDCTSPDDPERAARAVRFAELFLKNNRDTGVVVIPPPQLPRELTKLPDDWQHYDMRVYRAVAGVIYAAVVANYAFGTAQAAKPEVAPSPRREWAPAPSLTKVVAEALALPIEKVLETSGANETENWDSLRQVRVMNEVELAFGVSVAFSDTMEIDTVAAIRAMLLRKGVVAADDPSFVPNLFSPFLARALERPDDRYALFVSNGAETELTNGWVLQAAAAISSRQPGVEHGDIVAIMLPHSPHLYSAFIGAVLEGRVPTILPPLTRKQDPAIFREGLSVLLERVQPAAIVTSSALLHLLPEEFRARAVLVEDLALPSLEAAQGRFADAARPQSHQAVAFLQHSSGTTGHKKGVMLTHGQVLEQAKLYSGDIGLRSHDVIVSWLPLYHDMGLITSFVIPTLTGTSIVSLDALEWSATPTMLLDYIERERGSFSWLPNFAFHHIVNADPGGRVWDLTSLKALISCSEPCRPASFDSFDGCYGAMGADRSKLLTSYAMAENVFALTQSAPGKPARVGVGAAAGYLSSGRPLPGVDLEIKVDGVRASDGELGEICFTTTSMFSGYHRQPEISQERIRSGIYHTKDLGCVVDGELYVVGRMDDLLIVNGKNLVAHEVEDALNLIDGVVRGRTLLASIYNDDTGTSVLQAFVEAEEGVSAEALERKIRETVFSMAGIPVGQVQLLPKGTIVKSTSGKLARAQTLEKIRSSYQVGP